jgi:hypothetical protein
VALEAAVIERVRRVLWILAICVGLHGPELKLGTYRETGGMKLGTYRETGGVELGVYGETGNTKLGGYRKQPS